MHPPCTYRCFPNLLTVFVLAIGCSQSPKLELDQSGLSLRPQTLTNVPRQVWEVRLQTPPSALVPLDSVYMLITSHRGEVYTFNLDKGKRQGPFWQTFRKGITARLIDSQAQRLYLASAWEQQLRAYNIKRGKLAWKRKTPGIMGSMALANEHLLAASLMGKITAYALEDGRTAWERKLPGRIHHGLQITDSLAIVLTDHGTLYAFAYAAAYDPKQSVEPYPYRWKRDLSVNPNAQYIASNGRVYIADSQGRVICIDATDGRDVFHSNLGIPVYTPPLAIPGLILVATADGNVIALNDNDGSQAWRVPGEGLIKHPLLAVGRSSSHHVLTVFAQGELLALDAHSGEELWRLETGSPIEIATLTADGVLVVNRRNQLRRYHVNDIGKQH